MHMAHLSGNTSGASKSSSDWLNYTGFPGDVCVAFFNVPPRNKNAVAPNPLTKVCEIFKVHGIESLKYVREFHTPVCLLWWHFHAPKRDAERNELWLVVWHVGQTNMGGPWPIKPAIYSRPSAVSLKIWLRETNHLVALHLINTVIYKNTIIMQVLDNRWHRHLPI